MEVNKKRLETILRERWEQLKSKYTSSTVKSIKDMYFASMSEIDILCQCFNIPPFYPGEFSEYMKTLDPEKK
jgi:hypothetical protein